MSTSDHCDVVVVGAGLAGLSCAVKLSQAGRSVTVLEATDRVGGRVRTDVVDGFTLDHGFQVLLTAYPACQELLDYESLRLRPFDPGALVRSGGVFSLLGDPWRQPGQAIRSAVSPVGSIGDKIRIARIRRRSKSGSLTDLYQRPQSSTEEYLRQAHFSETMIDQFFRPLIGGALLDESLQTSSRMFEFVFRMFAEGDVTLPADGMAAIPRQLVERLPRGALRLHSSVASLAGRTVTLTNGSQISANQVVIATESDAAARLLNDQSIATQWNQATTFYYAADRSPDDRKWLMLRGDDCGPVQSAAILSNVAQEYSPPGRTLISVSLGGNPAGNRRRPRRQQRRHRRDRPTCPAPIVWMVW